MNILVVDDERLNLKIASTIIESHVEHSSLSLCKDPEEVLPLLENNDIDIVLLDIIMPRINGMELLKQIRAEEKYKDIQILMLTGVTNKESFRLSFEYGANDYISKPIDIVEFTARMRAAVQARKNIRMLRDAQFYLLQQEKLASLGEIAAGVAHEINNPIGFVNSNLNTMEKYLNKITKQISAHQHLLALIKNEKISRQELMREADFVEDLAKQQKINFMLTDLGPLVHESRDGVDRVAKIVRSLRNFARVGTEDEMALNDLVQIVEESLLIIWNELKYAATLEKNFAEIPAVLCNKTEISQVIINILNNSAHALKEQQRETMGKIIIDLYEENEYVCCRISDDGPGIPPAYLHKIFDPFFTTKEVGSGTGLGLSIAYGIINKHGGLLKAENAPNGGAIFIISLKQEISSSALEKEVPFMK